MTPPTGSDGAGAVRTTGRAPMEVKYWSRAGIMLTDWCNAACACCYANCRPACDRWMVPLDAAALWSHLAEAGPHGCRVHLTGGEILARPERVLEVCRLAAEADLPGRGGLLESIETNACWARDEGQIAELLGRLDRLGMGKLAISCDPYHQQFVPLENCRLLAGVARRVLGDDRVKVRWADWLEKGFDTSALSPGERREVFLDYAAAGRERFTGRAVDGLDERCERHRPDHFDGQACGGALLRGKHVHIAPTGEVWPATCVGISIGNALVEPVADLWRRLRDTWRQMPVIKDLASRGPVGVLDEALALGYTVRPAGYASKCQLCFDLRRFLHCQGRYRDYLGPSGIYSV